jgi:hypothetical protein
MTRRCAVAFIVVIGLAVLWDFLVWLG